MDFIDITEEPLKVEDISAQVTDKCTGATSLFVGTTRYILAFIYLFFFYILNSHNFTSFF